MKLFRVRATYTKYDEQTRDIIGENLPFEFYVISDDEFEASDKISKAINETPSYIDNWNLLEDPEQISSNDCGEEDSLLIE